MNNQYAIIDIETTGGSPHREKITEIAVVVYDGEKIVEKFETLINPERSIPPFITRLTGIDNDMVKDAPKFYEIAKDIVEITENRVFVAHNVRFDYGFIQEEFKRLGYNFSRKQLCTVRLSRKSFPGLPSYSLGKLIQHFDIKVNDRHRAMADVLATLELFKHILNENGHQQGVDPFFRASLKNVKLPEKIDAEKIMSLPEATGVYYFLDSADQVIYVGKSINIRKRIKQHFQNINPKSNKLYQRAVDLKYKVTGSEMVAFLLENEEIKALQPDINRASRKKNYAYFIHYYRNTSGYIVFEYAPNTISKRKNKQVLSEHINLLAARSALKNLQRKYELCEKHCGLDTRDGPCFDFGINQCYGACINKESPDDYNLRALEASQSLNLIDPADFILIDKGSMPGEMSIALVKDGYFHGYHYFDSEFVINDASELIDHIPKMTYYPEYNNIVRRFLNKPGQIKIVEF